MDTEEAEEMNVRWTVRWTVRWSVRSGASEGASLPGGEGSRLVHQGLQVIPGGCQRTVGKRPSVRPADVPQVRQLQGVDVVASVGSSPCPDQALSDSFAEGLDVASEVLGGLRQRHGLSCPLVVRVVPKPRLQ